MELFFLRSGPAIQQTTRQSCLTFSFSTKPSPTTSGSWPGPPSDGHSVPDTNASMALAWRSAFRAYLHVSNKQNPELSLTFTEPGSIATRLRVGTSTSTSWTKRRSSSWEPTTSGTSARLPVRKKHCSGCCRDVPTCAGFDVPRGGGHFLRRRVWFWSVLSLATLGRLCRRLCF